MIKSSRKIGGASPPRGQNMVDTTIPVFSIISFMLSREASLLPKIFLHKNHQGIYNDEVGGLKAK